MENQIQPPPPIQPQPPTPPNNNTLSQENKQKPSRWPMMLIIFGILGIVSTFIFGYGQFMMIGELSKIYKQLQTTINTKVMYAGSMVLFIIPFFQTAYGFYARKKQNMQGFLSKKQKTISMSLFYLPLIFSAVFIPYYVYSIMHPLYNQILDINYYNVSQQKPTPSPSPKKTIDETANWKTYRNEEYKFTFNYPLNVLIGKERKFNKNDIMVELYTRNAKEIDNVNISLAIYPQNKQIKLQEWINNYIMRTQIDGKVHSILKGNISPYNKYFLQGYTFKGSGHGGETLDKYVILQNKNIIVAFDLTGSGAGGSYNQNGETILDQILSTFRFLDQTTIISTGKTSPGGSYIITEQMLGDYNNISIKDKSGKVIVEDLVKINSEKIGYNVKFKCMCATYFKGWTSNSMFAIKIVNGNGEEYEYLVNAQTGIVDEPSFRRIN